MKREYLVRIRKKSFIIMTFLTPFIFLFIAIALIILLGNESDKQSMLVIDESGRFKGELYTSNGLEFQYANMKLEIARDSLLEGSGFQGIVHIPQFNIDSTANLPQIVFYASQVPGIKLKKQIERSLTNRYRDLIVETSNFSTHLLNNFKNGIQVNIITQGKKKSTKNFTFFATSLGYLNAILIYIFIFYYGTQIMRSASEEKNNRIIEVIITNTKPLYLMIGKLTGIGLLGLTQFGVWALMAWGPLSLSFSMYQLRHSAQQSENTIQDNAANGQEMGGNITHLLDAVGLFDLGGMFLAFVLFFLGAYLFYGSLFMVVGALSNNESDTQQYLLPVTAPLILSVAALPVIILDPSGSLAFWLSMIPFSSPIVMMMRWPFEVPLWQLTLSLTLLYLSGIIAMVFAAKAYRVGIMYRGAKVSFFHIIRWLRSSY